MELLSLHLQVLLARSAADPALLVQEIEHASQDSQKEDGDDDDCDNKTFALYWRRSTKHPQLYLLHPDFGIEWQQETGESDTGGDTVCNASKESVAVASFRWPWKIKKQSGSLSGLQEQQCFYNMRRKRWRWWTTQWRFDVLFITREGSRES